MPDYKITDIDYWENDAFLEIDGERYYFQFNDEPSLVEALYFLFTENRIKIV
jgi:hypothetical protein